MISDRFSKLVGGAAGLVDRAVVYGIQARGRSELARVDAMPHDVRLERFRAAHAAYDRHFDDTAAFFPAPPTIEPSLQQVRPGVWDASFPSPFQPFLPEVSERYLSRIENRTARARLYLAGPATSASSRPAVIAVHGYMGGQWLVEENAWPIEWMLRRGLDVVLPVLPLHAARAGSRRGPPAFPSSDPRLTNEGFRQAVADIRTSIAWLRRRGAPHVGVIGMSLGGYTTALLGTVTNQEIDFVMPMIPLASLADLAREGARLGLGPHADEQYDALDRAHRIVSPLARPLTIPKERALVVAAEYDRITPISHARRLAAHFDCEMVSIGGGHLVQVGRSAGFRALGAMLERAEIIPPRRPTQR